MLEMWICLGVDDLVHKSEKDDTENTYIQRVTVVCLRNIFEISYRIFMFHLAFSRCFTLIYFVNVT